jgi:hypothetical protein
MPFYYYNPVMLEPLDALDSNDHDNKKNTKKQAKGVFRSAWGAVLQAFTVDDVFTRKIK